MANPRKVWGQTRIRVNGVEYATEGKSSLELGGKKRDAVEADHQAGYFSESMQPSKLSCNILVTAGVSLAEMAEWDDVTVTMQTDTGQTYVINHGYSAEPISVSEGKAALVIQGPAAEELA